jgi:hypothetical protein
MELLLRVTTYIQRLNKKDFEKNVYMCLGVVVFIVVGMTYYIYSKSTELSGQIKRLEGLANKTVRIREEYNAMQEKEEQLEELLNEHKNFNIKVYFEQFCKDISMTPEPGWNTSVESINEKFDEIILPTTFKGQSTEKLVTILEEIDKKEIVYIKDVYIRTEKDKRLSFDVTIATKQKKEGNK